MERMMRVLGGIYGVVNTIFNLIISFKIANPASLLGYKGEFKFGTFLISFIVLEFTVVMVVALFFTMDYLVDKNDRLEYLLRNIESKVGSNGYMGAVNQSESPSKKNVSNSNMNLWAAANKGNPNGQWNCRKCGTLNAGNATFCKDCGEYK